MNNERVLHLSQNLNTLELSATLTPKVKFGILKNKMRMKDTLMAYDQLSQELLAEAKTANEYDEELATVDPGYAAEMDKIISAYGNNHQRFIDWKGAESTFVPFQVDLDEFLKCHGYNPTIVFNCYEIFVETVNESQD